MEQKRYDLIVVGGGPAGCTAALYAARAGFSVLVLEKQAMGGQMATTSNVENYPGFERGIDGWALAEKMAAGAARFGAQTAYDEVTGLELAAQPKVVHTSGGDLLAGAVVFAAGASPRLLGLPEEQELLGRGVAYCATCDGMFYKGRAVAVVGGGNSAAEDALYLAKLCSKVYLVHRRGELRADRTYRQALQKAANVELVLNSRPTRILHEETVTGLQVEDTATGQTRELACSGVFVAVGRVPDTALVRGQVELDAQGYVAAGESTRTSLPGVFAAGDVRAKPLRQIATAIADGAVAAKYAAESLDGLAGG